MVKCAIVFCPISPWCKLVSLTSQDFVGQRRNNTSQSGDWRTIRTGFEFNFHLQIFPKLMFGRWRKFKLSNALKWSEIVLLPWKKTCMYLDPFKIIPSIHFSHILACNLRFTSVFWKLQAIQSCHFKNAIFR